MPDDRLPRDVDRPVHWRPARDLEPFLEHDGTINDEEYPDGATRATPASSP